LPFLKKPKSIDTCVHFPERLILFYEYFWEEKKKIRVHGRRKNTHSEQSGLNSGKLSSGLHKRQGKILTVTGRQKVINVM
jgi:hypothetical protein